MNLPLEIGPIKDRYIALSTYRGNGRVVTTPVWFVLNKCHLYVYTAYSTGKVKRLRSNSHVYFSACDFRGINPYGSRNDCHGKRIDDPGRIARIEELFGKKYGWQFRLFMIIFKIAGKYPERTVLELTRKEMKASSAEDSL